MPLPLNIGSGRVLLKRSTKPIINDLLATLGFQSAINATINGNYSFTRASVGRKWYAGIFSDSGVDVPRFGEAGGLPASLLIEPASTQVLTQVLDISNAAWAKTNFASPTAIADLAGGTAAWRLLETTTTNVTHEVTENVSLTASTTYTLSVFAKANGRNFLRLQATNLANTVYYCNFNLSTGAIGSKPSQVYPTIVDYGNGWYRCSMSFPASTGATQPVVRIQTATTDNVFTFTGTATTGIDIYHPQLEIGFIPTSPISNTLGTRAKDLLSIPGSGNLGLGSTTILGWYNTSWDDTNQGLGYFFGCAVSSGVNRITFQKLATTLRILVYGSTAGAFHQYDVSITAGMWSANTWHHIAVVINSAGDSIKLYIDGVEKTGTLTTSGVPTPRSVVGTNFYIGADNTGNSQIVSRIWGFNIFASEKSADDIARIYTTEKALIDVQGLLSLNRDARRDLTPNITTSINDTTLGKIVVYNTTLGRWTNNDGSEITDRKAETISIINTYTNSEINGASPFSLGTCHYDSTVSRLGDGSGSFRFDAVNELMDGAAYASIPDATQPLTVKFFMKSTVKNAYIATLGKVKIGSGGTVHSSDIMFNRNTDVGVWEECVFNITPNDIFAGVNLFQVKLQRLDTLGGSVYVDSLKLYFGDTVYELDPSTGRLTFSGPVFRNDSLGNFERFYSGAWHKWFPYGVHGSTPYTSANMQNWYASKGFDGIWDNSLFGTDPALMLSVAANAIDPTYAPLGMTAIVEMKSYSLPTDPNYLDPNGVMDSKIQAVVASPYAANNFFCWYMDDEQPHDTNNVIYSLNRIRAFDSNHPIFLHLHHPNAQRNYSGSPVNITGTYITDISRNEFQIADKVQGNPFPLTIGQLSDELVAGSYRAQSYRALIMGARGLKYYRDDSLATFRNSDTYTSGMTIQVRQELDAMLAAGILSAPHWADWSVTSNDKSVFVGPRQVAGSYPYVLIANPYNAAKTITLTFKGISISTLKDFHNGLATVANITSRQATINLGAYGCYCLRGE